jgi:hypothetical protein
LSLSTPRRGAKGDSPALSLPLEKVEEEDIDIAKPVTAWARLAIGEIAKSKSARLEQAS